MRRYRIAIAGGGYRGLLVSDRTRIPGLVSIHDIEPTVRALDDGNEPPLTSRDEPDPEGKLRELDARLTEAHDSRGPASYVVFGLGALFALLTVILGSAFWGRAALLVGPVALAAALALSALEVTRPRDVGLALLGLVGFGRGGDRGSHAPGGRARGGSALDLPRLPRRARVLPGDELARRVRATSRRRRALLRDLEPGRDAAPRAWASRRRAARAGPRARRRSIRPRRHRREWPGRGRRRASSSSERASCSSGCACARSRSRRATWRWREVRWSRSASSSSASTRRSAARATSAAPSVTARATSPASSRTAGGSHSTASSRRGTRR